MSSGSNCDTATTLIALVLASALVIYLFGWTGVGGVLFFFLYAWFSPPPKQKTLLGQVAENAETGCGIIMRIIIVLLLAHLCGCR